MSKNKTEPELAKFIRERYQDTSVVIFKEQQKAAARYGKINLIQGLSFGILWTSEHWTLRAVFSYIFKRVFKLKLCLNLV